MPAFPRQSRLALKRTRGAGVVAVVAVLAMAALPPAAPAGETDPQPQPQPEPLHLVTGNDYAPYTGEDLPRGGMVTEIVRRAYAAVDTPVRIAFLPWKRGAAAVRSGEAHATFPYVKTEARQETFVFSDPVFTARQRPIVRPADAGSIQSFADLHGKVTCLPIGWSFGVPRLAEMQKAKEILLRRPARMKQCYQGLIDGEVDFLVQEENLARAAARRHLGGADRVHLESFVVDALVLRMMFAKDAAHVATAIARFERGLRRLRDSGAYAAIVRKHLGDAEAPDPS